jgi:nucleotide-binding universal stress UspA family protein
MARSKKNVILIPWDYSKDSEVALMHGVQLAKEVNNHIMLARLLENPGLFTSKAVKEKMIADETEKLKQAGKEVFEKYGINPFVVVEMGLSRNKFTTLAREAMANLVICSHHYKVNDKITFKPKDLVKRLNRLDIPFIVTQNKPAHNYYKEIVAPLDHDKKYKETLQWIVYLSKYYNCNINIIKPYIEDEFRKKDMANNIYFTKKMLDKKNIIYGIKTAKKKRKFEDEVIRFAENIDSDLIVMMVKKYANFISEKPDYEERIPIMVINRNSQIIKYGGFH